MDEGGSRGTSRTYKRRPRYFRQNEEGVLVDEEVTRRRAIEAARMAEQSKKDKRSRAAMKNKGKGTRVNYKTMGSVDYAALRQKDWFVEIPRVMDIDDPRFWCYEQKFIYEDIYSTLRVRPMRPLDITHMRSKQQFAMAVDVTERMGLHHLMGIQCDYNVKLIQQFYSTLVIGNDNAHTLKWMTGNHVCQSDFFQFADVLGYQFHGKDSPTGHRVHGPERLNKDSTLGDLYGPNGVVGEVHGLLPIYNQLVLIFRDTICPSGGNNDAIRGALVGLLALAHECANSEDPSEEFKLDVMDFIYHEMYDTMVNKHTMPYAPYIMLLIKAALPQEDFSGMCDAKHMVKKPYVKRKKTTTYAPSESGSFMADARGSGAPRGGKSSTIAKEVKKLNWVQRNILCMGVDTHKGQYKAYSQGADIVHNQKLILHQLSGARGDPPQKPAIPSYGQWNTSGIDYVEMERHLFPAPGSRTQAPPQADDDDDEEYDGEDGDDDEEYQESD